VSVGRTLLLAVGMLLGLARQGASQSAGDLFQQGVRAYRRAEFEAAAALFRRSLDFGARDSASQHSDGSGVLDYLAASELYRGRRDTAAAVFRRILQRDPRHQIDELVFPPEVSGLFDEVRRATKTAAVQVARDTTFRLESGRWSARLLASSYHQVNALILASDGSVVYEVYAGPLEDSLTVEWDGRDSLRQVVRSGNYTLNLVSTSGGRTMRMLRLPLGITVTRPDTLLLPPPPADSLFLPERTGAGPAVRSLLGGLGLGVVASTLPMVLANGAKPSPARFVVGGAVSLAGIGGFVARRAGLPIARNIEANRARRSSWAAEVDSLTRENAARRADVRVSIRAGTPSAVGSGIP
jgi:hypothetical protein